MSHKRNDAKIVFLLLKAYPKLRDFIFKIGEVDCGDEELIKEIEEMRRLIKQ